MHGGRQQAATTMPPTVSVLDFLRRPDHYPEPTHAVDVIETHLSWVFLTDDYVYKLKKPLRYDYLDFSTPRQRQRNCETEVRINSELAPDVYLGVITLAEDPLEGLNLDGRGRPVDYLVKMCRLSARMNLRDQLDRKAVDSAEVVRAAQRLTEFYVTRRPDGPVSPERLRQSTQRLYQELNELPVDTGGDALALRNALSAAIDIHWDVLAARVRVEAHGDLRPQHIYLGREPLFIDRLEFNAEFRRMDPLEELAFLSLECERLGGAWVGERFIEAYVDRVGDHISESLLSLYKGYRALMWAVLTARHLARDDTRKPWADIARTYVSLGKAAVADLPFS